MKAQSYHNLQNQGMMSEGEWQSFKRIEEQIIGWKKKFDEMVVEVGRWSTEYVVIRGGEAVQEEAEELEDGWGEHIWAQALQYYRQEMGKIEAEMKKKELEVS